MFYGFAAAWIIPMIYLITLILRERRIREEITRLRKTIESDERN